MSRLWARSRVAVGVLVLVVLLWRFGTGPFADAWRLTTWQSVLTALLLTAIATVANAWRWRVVARALGAPLSVRGSIAAYYRSQFLNATLPGGILGDAHRGVRHGRAAGDLSVGLRATVWDRVTGQLVQVLALSLAIVVLPTPLQTYAPVAVVAVAVCVVAGWALVARRPATSFVGRDLRVVLRPAVCGRVIVASGISSAAHVGVFLVAAATVGVTAGPADLVTVALAVLVGSAVPLNVAGWGPREGVTAAVFALVGLGSATGLTVSVLFGVLATVATVPGIAVLLADVEARRRRPLPVAESTPALEEAARA
ncbi:MAG: lysylphosphatidylglycerol synthase transmembrane domain-containing protein [Nocardioides sp.]